jgi:hypothetical protein
MLVPPLRRENIILRLNFFNTANNVNSIFISKLFFNQSRKLTTLRPACPKDFINDLPSHSATLFSERLCCYNQDDKRTFTADFCVAKPKKGRIAIEKLKSVSDDSYFNPLSGNP